MNMLEAKLFFDKDELTETQSLEEFIMQFLIRHDISGATAIRGDSGFGPKQLLKRPDILFSFDERPMLIIFIDEEEKIRKTLTELKTLVKNCVIVTTQVEKW